MGRRLNTSTPTVIQTELVPLDENFAIEANGTLEQWYYDNTSQYAPDRSITPLILSPKIMVADKDSQQSWDDARVAKSVVAWSVMESDTWVDITSASALSDYELSGNNLIVHKNVSYSQGVTIMCKLTYVDPRDNGIYITTQETVLLTCNRDANVVLPEVVITSPSARSFNPLVDGASTEYDFDAVVTNSPDVEMQSSDIATYEMNGSGTEEIISDANGIAPILDIRYPDSETQFNQEFAYRQTANGEKPDETGAAFISKIKGNTVAWNQLIRITSSPSASSGVSGTLNTDGTVTLNGTATASGYISCNFTPVNLTANHKVLFSEIGVYSAQIPSSYTGSFTTSGDGAIITIGRLTGYENTVLLRFNSGDSFSNKRVYVQLIDLTLIYGAGYEPTTVEEFEADYERWFGKPLSYEEYDEGSLRPVLMQSVKTTGFNQWDEEYTLTGLKADGTTDTNNKYLTSKNFIPVKGGTAYFFNYNGSKNAGMKICQYDASYNHIGTNIGKSGSQSKQFSFTTEAGCRYIKFNFDDNYGTNYTNDICINISDPSKNGTYEPYEGHIASVPVTSAKGKLLDANGSPVGNSVFVFPDGLKKAGNIQDEIFVEDGVVKAIKRVGSVDLGDWNWVDEGKSYHTYTANSHGKIKTPPTFYQAFNGNCSKLTVVQWDGQFHTQTGYEYSISLHTNGNISIYDQGLPAPFDAAQAKAYLKDVMLYYELATPETYVLDPVQNPFIYKWFGIDANNNEVLAETLPWYVSGQDTSKLKVDAMWGEKINVVLRAMMPTGVLSPSKAYAALTWRIPDVDTTVISYNGSAVRSDTNSMTFGTIVNINGRNLEDSVKAANLRFKWVYRKNFTRQETVAGWSQGESDQITIQASNLRSVRGRDSTLASTFVFPYVYCLGAWTTSQGTETGYSKPTTTKNGVTYYRIVD